VTDLPHQATFVAIVPLRNKATYIEGCLNSLITARSDDGDVAIVVVDNRSTDDSRSLAERFLTHASRSPDRTLLPQAE
jgi:glycosyltransferase involved in cell wall biosynthesis